MTVDQHDLVDHRRDARQHVRQVARLVERRNYDADRGVRRRRATVATACRAVLGANCCLSRAHTGHSHTPESSILPAGPVTWSFRPPPTRPPKCLCQRDPHVDGNEDDLKCLCGRHYEPSLLARRVRNLPNVRVATIGCRRRKGALGARELRETQASGRPRARSIGASAQAVDGGATAGPERAKPATPYAPLGVRVRHCDGF